MTQKHLTMPELGVAMHWLHTIGFGFALVLVDFSQRPRKKRLAPVPA